MACLAFRVVFIPMTFEAFPRVDSPVQPVLYDVIPSVGKHPFGAVAHLHVRLQFFLFHMAILAERRLVTGGTEGLGLTGVLFVVFHECPRMAESFVGL